MLLINWEIFNPENKEGKYATEAEDYAVKTKAFKKRFESVGLVRFVNTQVKEDLKGLPIPPCTLPLIARDGLTEWAYVESMSNIRTSKDGVRSLNKKSRLLRQGEILVDVNREMDLLYFLMEKSSLVKNGSLKLDDVRERQEEQVRKERNAIRLKSAIYGEASPLTSETMLREVCHSLGINGADTKTEAALRIALEAFVNAENKKNDVRAMKTENFLDFINMGDEVYRRGIVGKAVAKKVIEYTKQYGWIWSVSRDTIVRVPEARYTDKFPYLCEFFSKSDNAEVWTALIKELSEKGYFEDDQPYDEMKWLAKEAGIKVSQVSKKELAMKLSEHFSA